MKTRREMTSTNEAITSTQTRVFNRHEKLVLNILQATEGRFCTIKKKDRKRTFNGKYLGFIDDTKQVRFQVYQPRKTVWKISVDDIMKINADDLKIKAKYKI